jgi:receptor protein-tyrosine kinase
VADSVSSSLERKGDTQSVDLSEVLRMLRERKWIIAGCALIALAIAVVLGIMATPMYSATAQILRQTTSLDLALFDAQVFTLSDRERDLATASDMVKLSTVAENVKTELNSQWDANHLQKMITVSSQGQTNIINIVAVSPSPTEAADVANSFARQFILYRKETDRETLATAREQVEAQLAAMSAEELASERGKTLSQKVEELAVLESLQTGGYELIQLAEVPKDEYSPRIYRDSAIALIIGLVVGLLLAALLHVLDRRLKTEDAVQAAFGSPIVASIPRVGKGWMGLGQRRSRAAVGFRDAGDSAIEAFRTLRSNLKFFEVEKRVKTILITSSLPREGKSITTINLALSLAMSGARVIVLEGDLRRPMLESYLDVHTSTGFSNLLAGTHTVSDVVRVADARSLLPPDQTVPSDTAKSFASPTKQSTPVFHFIAAGPLPPNPAELLGTNRAAEIIEKLASVCDYLIVDSPPLLLVSDALELAKKVDAVLLVARLYSTTGDDARKASESLAKIGVHPLGVVLSGVPKPKGHYRRYGEYYSKA